MQDIPSVYTTYLDTVRNSPTPWEPVMPPGVFETVWWDSWQDSDKHQQNNITRAWLHQFEQEMYESDAACDALIAYVLLSQRKLLTEIGQTVIGEQHASASEKKREILYQKAPKLLRIFLSHSNFYADKGAYEKPKDFEIAMHQLWFGSSTEKLYALTIVKTILEKNSELPVHVEMLLNELIWEAATLPEATMEHQQIAAMFTVSVLGESDNIDNYRFKPSHPDSAFWLSLKGVEKLREDELSRNKCDSLRNELLKQPKEIALAVFHNKITAALKSPLYNMSPGRKLCCAIAEAAPTAFDIAAYWLPFAAPIWKTAEGIGLSIDDAFAAALAYVSQGAMCNQQREMLDVPTKKIADFDFL